MALLGNATNPKPALEARKEEAKELVPALESGAITVGVIVRHVTAQKGHKLAQHEFLLVLLKLVKRDTKSILNAAYAEIQHKNLQEVQERIKAELTKKMGGLADLIPQEEPERLKGAK